MQTVPSATWTLSCQLSGKLSSLLSRCKKVHPRSTSSNNTVWKLKGFQYKACNLEAILLSLSAVPTFSFSVWRKTQSFTGLTDALLTLTRLLIQELNGGVGVTGVQCVNHPIQGYCLYCIYRSFSVDVLWSRTPACLLENLCFLIFSSSSAV